jgi:hypothetical protein
MSAYRTIGRACLLLALGASSTFAQKKGEKASDEVEFTSSCACTSCDGRHRWDVKTDKTPAPASAASGHIIASAASFLGPLVSSKHR